MNLQLGDSLEVLKGIEDNFVDAVVCDPPYGLKFMSKRWDYDVPSVELWHEVLRVLKPGGHLLSFGGTRTYHRMVVAIEDAGFEIRDQLQWIYGSGFPKSHNISKAIDKAAGAEREIVGENPNSRPNSHLGADSTAGSIGYKVAAYNPVTAPSTPEAKQWDGWGSALKPSNEPVCLARKPLEKGLTLAENVLKWGTGGLNIDGCRIEGEVGLPGNKCPTNASGANGIYGKDNRLDRQMNWKPNTQGRWPANVLFDEEAAKALDEQSGISKSQVRKISATEDIAIKNQVYGKGYIRQEGGVNDSGGASRFFYVAKASKRERNAGLEGMPKVSKSHIASKDGGGGGWSKDADKNPNLPRENFHPTVKPIKLMQYLCKLITPPQGIVLDPFMGSGSTGIAALKEGFGFYGIELDPEYFEIAKARLKYTQSKLSEEYK